MNRDRWVQIKELFDAAFALPADEREAFLGRAASEDEALRDEVRSLLAAESQAGRFSARLFPPSADDSRTESDVLPAQSRVGQMIGHYRIDAIIGEGGMGVVYRAHDTRLERTVALKLVNDAALDASARSALLREARHASALNHPHICTIYEIGDLEGEPYIAMEWVDGRSLDEVVANGELEIHRVVGYGRQIADALAHAHERGIVHRDLKSANIAIANDGRAKVLDFGIARRLDAATVKRASRPDVAVGTALAGTLAYIAPEVLRGDPADERSDIWALGVVLHELLAGVAPFTGRTGFELTSAILHDPPASLPPQVPKSVAAIVARCLQKDPRDRYPHAADVEQDLEAAERNLDAGMRINARVAASATAAVVIVAVVVTWGIVGRSRSRVPAVRAERSLAVLPLENLSGQSGQEYLADGLTDALITDLSQIGALHVISRTSVMGYKGSRRPLPEIARALHVDLVVEGSVVRVNDHVRVTAQLIDGATDRHLWARRYERNFSDVLNLQREVARTIAREIRVTVTPREEARLSDTRPVNPAAHEAYLEGRYAWNKLTEAGLTQALDYFEHAIRIDPDYAPAYAGIADTYNRMQFYSGFSPNIVFPRAREAAQKALQLDETLPEAHAALAYIVAYYDWKWADAEREFRRTLELEPNNADVYHSFSRFLAATGRIDDALATLRHAQELDPMPLEFKLNEGITFYFGRQYDRAIEQLNTVLALEPKFFTANWGLGLAYEQKHDYPRAIVEFERAVAGSTGKSANMLGSLGHAYAVAGRRDDAIRVLGQIDAVARTHYVPSFFSAEVYLGLGDVPKALELLDRSYEEHSTLLSYAKMDPRLDPLRGNAQFVALLNRIGLTTATRGTTR
jgi:serine/threonine-protein kinase